MESAFSIADNIGVILLAGGSSARLGRPKQMLEYRGGTLLQHSLQAASASTAYPVVVVLGAKAANLKEGVQNNKAHVVVNEHWQEGMAASIRCGVKTLEEIAPETNGCIVMVCDQPFVTPGLINELITAHQRSGKQIVACGYGGTYGPPVFFHKSLFEELYRLQGDVGARGIVARHTGLAEIIPFPEGSFDVDTEADYEKVKTAGQGGVAPQ